MLRELHISGLGVIEDVDLELHPGLNVLSGETGAGKTMITVALTLVAGGRGSAHIVRAGATAARIQARFDAPAGDGGWAEDGEVLLARSIAADGRGGARIGGQLATVSALAGLGERLLEVHGQHQTLRVLEPATQSAFLDRFAGDAHLVALATYRETYEALAAVETALGELRTDQRARERELDLLAYQVREIEDVGPGSGETSDLETEEARLGHVERLQELARAAHDALTGEGGVGDALAPVARGLADAALLDPGLDPIAARGAAHVAELSELGHDLRAYLEALAADPERLELVRARLAALRGLQRKYGASDDDVLAFLRDASARLRDLDTADERLQALESETAVLRAAVAQRAERVTQGRTEATPRLERALHEELDALGMPQAGVQVGLTGLPAPGPNGAELVELGFSAGEGHPVLPLARSASGGELSRVMLGCRSVLADLDDVPTLVFDEIDAGIGGEAGLAVGRRLARLANGRQILVVTHLPQIACFADRQFLVRKAGGSAAVEVVRDDDRVRELARMLAGLGDSAHASSHAQELLAVADRVRSTV